MTQTSKEADRLTLNEAAARLSMTEAQVRRRVLQGRLVGGQALGRWWYVTSESVDRYLAAKPAEEAV